jgi:hypothetical protein
MCKFGLTTEAQERGPRERTMILYNEREPPQLRTRNAITKTQRARSISGKTAVKSAKLIDILPLITVWWQVRVLPGPPMNQ